jgi:hypothetical protein
MASAAAIEALCGGLTPDQRRVLKAIFDYLLTNLRFGQPVTAQRAENWQAYYLEGRTPAVANTPFDLAHGLASAPYLAVPVLSLQTVGAQLVPLTVTRAADANRIYLQSSAADAPFMLLVEGGG